MVMLICNRDYHNTSITKKLDNFLKKEYISFNKKMEELK